MNELIKIQERDGKKAVSARDLYEFLEVKTRFNDWITRRIEQYDFIENVDYVSLTQNRVSGGFEKDYALSVDAAKELSMVEGNEKGKQARRYFIACEKAVASNAHVLPHIQDLTQAKILAAEFNMKALSMNDASKIPLLKAINEPLGLPVPDYVDSKGVLLSISQIIEGTGISAQKANKILSEHGVLVKRVRRTSKGKEKPFWVIADEYSDWGENKVHPQNQDEVQTKWYEYKKEEILVLVMNNKAA